MGSYEELGYLQTSLMKQLQPYNTMQLWSPAENLLNNAAV